MQEEREYDTAWEGDPRRQDAMRPRMHNNRYPSYHIPPARERSTPLWAVLALAAWPALLFVAWCVLP